MTESEFNRLADAALARIETATDNCSGDVEGNRSGNVLEIEFSDGQKIIINRHAAAREIWVAARSGGFHFRWDGAAWRNTRDGSELFAALSTLVSQQLGRGVRLLG